MKKRLLNYSLATAAVAAISVGIFAHEPQQRYTPRGGQTEESAAGAIAYLNSIRANQITGTINQDEVIGIRNQVDAMIASNKTNALNLSWDAMGPDNVGGRTRAFIIDRNNNNTLFAAGVAGGVFKSTNGGLSWVAISDNLDNMAVMSLVQTSNGDIYASTGEGMYAGLGNTQGAGTATSPGMVGNGIYKSTDGGVTWNLLNSTKPSGINNLSEWSSIGTLGCDPTNANIIYAGNLNSLKRSDDGGATWSNPINATGITTDFTVASDGSVWVNIGGKTFYSANGTDNSFTEISKQLGGPTALPRSVGRQKYAVAPQDNNYIYCLQAAGEEFGGLYRSTDRGATWAKIGTKTTIFDPLCSESGGCQASWDLLLGVSSQDKNHVFIGGVRLWEWKQATGWRRVDVAFDFPGIPWYIHSDKHNIVFHPTNANIVYITSDGGITKSTDGGVTWTTLNKNFNVTQYYNIGFGKDRILVGGTQDNGSHVIDYLGNTPQASRDLGAVNGFSGDGGFSDISWLNNKIYFTSYQQGRMGRSENYGESFTQFYSPRITTIGTIGTSAFSGWMVPFELFETTNDPLSTDSIQFKALPAVQSLGFGGGIKSFTNTLRKPELSAKFIASTFKVVSGALTIVSDALGNLSGDGTGTFNALTGDYTIIFTNTPVAEIVVKCEVQYLSGSVIEVGSLTNGLPFNYTLTSLLNSQDSVKIQDPVQSIFACGFRNSVWITRKALDFSDTPEWWKVATYTGTTQSIEISADGNYLWVGTQSGSVIRVSNLKEARSVETADIDLATTPAVTYSVVANYGTRNITGIAVDPNNPDRVAITVGNYGNSAYVYYSTNATAPSPTFVSKQGNLPLFPAYSVTFDKANANSLIIGTEYGVWSTDNINSTSVNWTIENNGLPRTPVFTLEQYRTKESSPSSNDLLQEGDIFAGTHGRGIYRTTTLMTNRPVSVKEEKPFAFDTKTSALILAPNPAKDYTEIVLNLTSATDVNIFVRDISGKLVKQMRLSKMPFGVQKIRVETAELANGTYLVSVQSGTEVKSAKLNVVK